MPELETGAVAFDVSVVGGLSSDFLGVETIALVSVVSDRTSIACGSAGLLDSNALSLDSNEPKKPAAFWSERLAVDCKLWRLR